MYKIILQEGVGYSSEDLVTHFLAAAQEFHLEQEVGKEISAALDPSDATKNVLPPTNSLTANSTASRLPKINLPVTGQTRQDKVVVGANYVTPTTLPSIQEAKQPQEQSTANLTTRCQFTETQIHAKVEEFIMQLQKEEVITKRKNLYSLKFVGLMIFQEFFIFSYPKYFIFATHKQQDKVVATLQATEQVALLDYLGADLFSSQQNHLPLNVKKLTTLPPTWQEKLCNLTTYSWQQLTDQGNLQPSLPSFDPAYQKFKTILEVLQKYNKELQFDELQGMDTDELATPTDNLLRLTVALLQDYLQHGLYSTNIEELTHSDNGEIDWEYTIANAQEYVVDDQVYYFDPYSRHSIENQEDFIRQLHGAILNKLCVDFAQILPWFGMNGENFNVVELEELGDVDYLQQRLHQEYRQQFVTSKLETLKLLMLYFEQQNQAQEEVIVNTFWCKNFKHLWEVVCSNVLGNNIKKELKNLITPTLFNKVIQNFLDKNKEAQNFSQWQHVDRKELEKGIYETNNKQIAENNIQHSTNAAQYVMRNIRKFISHPKWQLLDTLNPNAAPSLTLDLSNQQKSTFIPDIVVLELPLISEKSSDYELFTNDDYIKKKHLIYIYDAKYYCITEEDNKIKCEPGVNDIAKQYLYAHAYHKGFIKKYNLEDDLAIVHNGFILPLAGYGNQPITTQNKFKVSIDFLDDFWSKNKGSLINIRKADFTIPPSNNLIANLIRDIKHEGISVMLIPAHAMFVAYLQGKVLSYLQLLKLTSN